MDPLRGFNPLKRVFFSAAQEYYSFHRPKKAVFQSAKARLLLCG